MGQVSLQGAMNSRRAAELPPFSCLTCGHPVYAIGVIFTVQLALPVKNDRSRSRKLDHNTMLAKICLHELPAGAIVLHQLGRIEHSLF